MANNNTMERPPGQSNTAFLRRRSFPVPLDESARLEDLRSYEILDTPPELAFDELVNLAAKICDAPMAAVSLVDSDRQWFKARLGIQPTQTGRENAFCAHGIVNEENLFVVEDARQDPRFSGLPLVQEEPHIQFYTGAKLSSAEGHALGMLCVMDRAPRKLNDFQKEALQILARQVSARLELHRELEAHQRSRELLELKNKQLRKSESLYHSLVEHAPLFILRKNTEGRITFANQFLCKAHHRTQAEVIGRTDFDLLPKEIAARIRLTDQRVIATGQTIETIEQIAVEDGRSIHVQIVTQPLYDDRGVISGVQVISKDFTERHRLEKELEERVRERTGQLESANHSLQCAEQSASGWKHRYDLIVGSAGLAVYDIDRVSGEVVWSSSAERVLGIDPSLVNRGSSDWVKLVHAQDRDAVMRGIEAAIENGQSFEMRYRLRHGPDHFRWIQDQGLVIPDAHGRCVRVLGLMQDITQLKLSEDTMKEQARLLDQSKDAIMVRDLNNRVLYWNQTAQQMYGWSFGEALGKPIHDLLLRGEVGHIPTAQATALKNGEWSGEIKVYAKSGRELTVNSRWTLLRDQDGKPNAFLVTHTDLTEQKLLEAKFLRAQRLESVGALASGIAHDLNNVFTPILMAAQLLRDETDQAIRTNMLGILTSSAQRGAGMVKQVLTFSRGVDKGCGLVQVKHLISELEKMMRDTFPPGIRIETILARDLWLVRGDATQLYQVLINLCVNARDAMPDGGTLRIEASNSEINQASTCMNGEIKPGPYIAVRVTDTGTGMTSEVQNKIFEPFFTTKEPGKGTGLGLSTVLSLVKTHGGCLKLDSKVGTGTRFDILLPAECSQTLETPADDQQLPRGRGELLLIVDDESAVREIIKTTLEAYEYNVFLASDGAEAVSIYQKQGGRIALVITDIAMPGLDGFAMIEQLRKLSPDIKLIVMTGLAESETVEKLAAEGISILPKPVAPEPVLRAIHEALHPQGDCKR
jgi:PAS domain S-box-containing protein